MGEMKINKRWCGTESGDVPGNMKSKWWQSVIEIFKKEVDANVDPEKEIQKIYQHWIKSYLSK